MITTIPENYLEEVISIEDSMDMYNVISKASLTPRRGYISNSYKDTDGAHMLRMALQMKYLINELKLTLDENKCLWMCIVHDIAESYIGDITPTDGVNPDMKHDVERAIIEKIFNTNCPEDLLDIHEQILSIYYEFEQNETKEAQFIHFLDKLDFLQEMIRLHNQDKRNQSLVTLCKNVLYGIENMAVVKENVLFKRYVDKIKHRSHQLIPVKPFHEKSEYTHIK